MKLVPTYLQLFVAITRNEKGVANFMLSKQEISRLHYLNFDSDKSLGRNVHFFNFLGTTEISRISEIFVYTPVVLLKNFPELFELCLLFKYSRSYEVLQSR